MKKLTFFTIGIMFLQTIFASVNWTKIDNAKLSDTKITLLSSTDEESIIQFDVNAYNLHIVMTPRGKAYTVSIPDGTFLQMKGTPNLPKLSTSLIIPNNKEMQVEVQYSDYIEINNIEIAPSKGVITRNINPLTIPYTYGEVYNVNSFFPGELAQMNEIYVVRNYRGGVLRVNPVQYNPITKTLRIYKKITVRVTPSGNPAQINPLMETRGGHTTTPEFQDFYSHRFLNYSTFQTRYTPIDEGHPGRMLVISDASFMTAMQPFVDWKNQKGIFTEMVDVSTIGNAAAIKTYVQNYYTSNNDFCYLLLVGDGAQVPTSSTGAGDSDNNYGYLAGSDHRIDIFVGRFSAENATQVTTQVDRTIHYEKDVTSAESWMQYGLCVASDQGPGDDNEYDYEHEDNIKADYLAYGYTSVATCYQSNSGETDANITNAINTHCGVASYTGHGDVTMWYSVNPNSYTNTNVNALTNDNQLPFIFSVACVIGDFVSNTCFSEAWQRATNGGNPTGAIANIGSTINQSWNSPMCAQDEMVDILVESYSNNIKRTFGGIVANGWGQMIDEYTTDGENMADTWTVFGDASVMVRTKQPQDMTITHAANINVGATLFDVNCDVEGALVSITKDNVILGTGYISGGTVSVSLSPAISGTGNILVTVTAYNKVTYQQLIPITSSNTLTASFSGTPLSIPVGGTVTFTDASFSPTSITSWNWKFDVTGVGAPAPTPATQNTQGPHTVTYNSPGLYTVRLTVTDGSGSDSLTRTDYVEVTATTLTANFSGTPLSIPVGGSVDFTDLTSGGTPTTWDWNFDVTSVGGANPPVPATETIQNPSGVVYNAIGLYTVSLTVGDGTETDVETKTDYIEVIDPNQLQIDFTGIPTTIIQGQTVDFTSTVTNGGPATSWNWTFNGAVTTSSTVENPSGIQYDNPGTYSVFLEASDGVYTDTLTKVAYINVLDSTSATDADFIGDPTTILAGGSVDFTNLSTGVIDSVEWIFDGGVPVTSTLMDPTGIVYGSIGDYDVTLIVYSSLGNDTAFKPAYIHVIDPSQMDTVYTDFQATTARLIVQGNTVNYEDLSSGYPVSWDWTFQGGVPGTSTTQHPQGILYSTPGIYDVTLSASNAIDGDTLTKTNYIVVTSQQWPDPNGFCDTISNVQPNEIPLTFRHLTTGGQWGYFPGHNSLNITAYADRFVNYTFSGVRAIIVPVVKAAANSSGAKVRFSVWGEDTLGNIINTPLGYQDFPISSFTPYMFSAIEFNNPIPVSEKFYVGYQIYYGSPQDTFVVYMGPDRGQGGLSTLYCKKGGWKTASQALGDSINTSLGIKIVGCLVGNETIDLDRVVTIYPNPAHDIVMIDFNDLYASDAVVDVFDMLGKRVDVKIVANVNKIFMDMSNNDSGIYFVKISVGNSTVTKKISLIK